MSVGISAWVYEAPSNLAKLYHLRIKLYVRLPTKGRAYRAAVHFVLLYDHETCPFEAEDIH